MTQRELLKKALESISYGYHPTLGICSLIPKETKGLFMDLCKRWPEYSGDVIYPVPHPFLDNPCEAFYRASPEEKWNPEHPYGAARWRLIHFCIEKLSV